MLNRNAARHLLLVVSILICAFIYAGYYLRTRGDGAPPEPAAAPAAPQGTAAPGLRPSSPADAIPSARGEDLALVPPVGSSTRPSSPPPAVAPSAPSGAITGLVPSSAAPGASSTPPPATTTPSSSNAAPGTALPLPGFSPPADSGGNGSGSSSSPPVLTLPGMGAPADDGDPDDDSGDFAFLPGSGSAPVSSAPVLTPPQSSAPSTPSRGTTLAPPPAAAPATTPPAPSAAGTETVLRPPSRQNGSLPAPTQSQTPSPTPSARPSTPSATRTPSAPTTPPAPARTPPAPARTSPASSTTPPAPPTRTPPPSGPGARIPAEEDAPRSSDSLRIYVVAPGDTLSSIAMRELGSGFLADNIFLLNRDVIDDPNHLLAGVKIRLPYANPSDSSGPAANGSAVPGRRPTQGLGSTHTVVHNDTLSSIALRYYGTSAGWRFLYEANKTILPDPNKLSVGMELTIPPYEQ